MRIHLKICVGIVLLSGCARGQYESPPIDAGAVRFDYSGLARNTTDSFLVVHDAKTGQAGARLGVVRISPSGKPLYQALRWGAPVLPSDLESICAIPDRPAEFLAVESGYRAGKGLIFHIKIADAEMGSTVQLQGMLRLPTYVDEVEGSACVKTNDGRLLLILGERGGTKSNPTGRLRWGPITLDGKTTMLAWPESQKLALQPLPGHGKGWRGCSDLFVDEKGRLWLSAAYDPGDTGPFRSSIVQVGRVDVENLHQPLLLDDAPEIVLTLDGVKIEGLGGPFTLGADFTVASDDEDFGGTFRSIIWGK